MKPVTKKNKSSIKAFLQKVAGKNYTSGDDKKGMEKWTKGVIASLDELVSMRRFIERSHLLSTAKVRTFTAGTTKSPFKGRGMEFDEVRVYQAGDDIRTIDWRVTAKTGIPHTKLFHEEREKPVYIVVDARVPMRFGTKGAFKSVIAARIAAALAWKTLDDGDRIGGLVMSASGNVELEPHRSRRRLLHYLQALSSATADSAEEKGVSMAETFAILRRVLRYGGQAYIISDFSDFDEEAQRHLSRVAPHCDIGCVFVHDILEASPPPPALYRISDGERVLTMNAGDPLWCKAYEEHFAAKRNKIEDFCRTRRIAFTSVCTADNLSNTFKYGLFAPKITEIEEDIPEDAEEEIVQ